MIQKESLRFGIFNTTVLNIISRALDYIRLLLLVVYVGIGATLDAFILAFSIVTLYVIIFGDVFDSIGAPELSVASENENGERVDFLTKHLFVFSIILSVVLTIILFASYSYLLPLLAIGLSPDRYILISDMLLYMMPLALIYLPYHALGTFYRSDKIFSFFYFTRLIVSLVTIIYLLIFYERATDIALSMSIGYLAGFILILFNSTKRYNLMGKIDYRYYLEVSKLFIPLLMILATFQLFNLTDRAFASYLPDGTISIMFYALMLVVVVPSVMVIGNLVITNLAISTEPEKLINNLIYLCIYISIPIVIFVQFDGESIIKVLFGFLGLSIQEVDSLSLAFKLYIFILPFMLIWPIFYRYFQIKKELRTVLIISLASVATNLILNYVFMFVFGMGMMGLILATVINMVFIVVAIAWNARYKFNINVFFKDITHRVFVLSFCILSILVPFEFYLAEPGLIGMVIKVVTILAGGVLLVYYSEFEELEFLRVLINRAATKLER